eukprot:m.4700 g.4700  ORF g.4700 m.4700 type:complete len:51 (+) comp3069_c0_seq1:35-187(+)
MVKNMSKPSQRAFNNGTLVYFTLNDGSDSIRTQEAATPNVATTSKTSAYC